MNLLRLFRRRPLDLGVKRCFVDAYRRRQPLDVGAFRCREMIGHAWTRGSKVYPVYVCARCFTTMATMPRPPAFWECNPVPRTSP